MGPLSCPRHVLCPGEDLYWYRADRQSGRPQDSSGLGVPRRQSREMTGSRQQAWTQGGR